MADLILFIACSIILLSILLTFIRLIKGPDYMNRVVAFDVMTISSISLIIFISYFLKRSIYIDVSLVYALLSFIGVIAVARFSEKGDLDD